MANFTYTASKSFTPFTFEQMLKPLAMYTEEYNTIQEGIGELNNKAAIWDNLANQQTDERTYKRYKDFSEKLSNQADMLARQGLTPSSRKALLDLKRGYVSEIVPIEQAYNARAEEAKSQYEGRSKGLVYEGEAATSSLDRYLDNPSIRYNYANSQEGFKRVATTASALSKGLMDMNYGNGKRLDSYTKTWLQKHGYKDTDIASAISDIRKILNGDTDVQSNGVLRAILTDEMNTSGVNSWTNRAAVNDYFNRVAPALYQAVGQTTVSPYEDYGARLQGQLKLAFAKNALSTKNSTLKVPDVTSYYFPKDIKKIPELLDDKGHLKESNSNYGVSKNYKLLSALFKDGKFTKPSSSNPYNSETVQALDYYNNINDILLNAGFSQKAINAMNKSTIEQNLKALQEENINDAIGRDVYRFALDDNATKLLISRLKGRGLPVKEIQSMKDMIPQLGGDETLEYDDDNKPTSDILYDPKGNLISILYDGKYYKLPKGMISNNFYTLMDKYSSADTQQIIKSAEEVQRALLEKANRGEQLTDNELLVLEKTNSTLDYWGNVFNNIGNRFVEYVGTKNINTGE